MRYQRTVQDGRAVELLCAVTGLYKGEIEYVIEAAGGVRQLARMAEDELAALPGVGPRRAAQIRAMTEWSLLLNELEHGETVRIRSPADIANLLMPEMGLLDQEELRVVLLNTKNEVMGIKTVYKGSVNTTVIRISEVLREAVRLNCPGMVLVHNHPSADVSPSPEDVLVTEQIRQAGELLNISLLDHVIIGLHRYLSLKERGLGFGAS